MFLSNDTRTTTQSSPLKKKYREGQVKCQNVGKSMQPVAAFAGELFSIDRHCIAGHDEVMSCVASWLTTCRRGRAIQCTERGVTERGPIHE